MPRIRSIPEKNWREELAQLESLLKGAQTEKEAKQSCDAISAEFNGYVKDIEGKVKTLRDLLKSKNITTHPGWTGQETEQRVFGTRTGYKSGTACGCDGCVILGKLEGLEYKLSEAKRIRETKIKIAGSWIKGAHERDKLRPRLAELRKREVETQAASRTINQF